MTPIDSAATPRPGTAPPRGLWSTARRLMVGMMLATLLGSVAVQVVGTDPAGAIDRNDFNGGATTGYYICRAPSRHKVSSGDVWADVSRWDGTGGQTIQLKLEITYPDGSVHDRWSGWREVGSGLFPVAYDVPAGSTFFVCAQFGGGNGDVYDYFGSIYY